MRRPREHDGAVILHPPSPAAPSYCSEEEVSARLQALETQRDLLRHQWEGWCVWPLLRFTVAVNWQRLPFDAGAKGFTRGQQLTGAARDVFRFLRLPRARRLVKTYSSAHMEMEQG